MQALQVRSISDRDCFVKMGKRNSSSSRERKRNENRKDPRPCSACFSRPSLPLGTRRLGSPTSRPVVPSGEGLFADLLRAHPVQDGFSFSDKMFSPGFCFSISIFLAVPETEPRSPVCKTSTLQLQHAGAFLSISCYPFSSKASHPKHSSYGTYTSIVRE